MSQRRSTLTISPQSMPREGASVVAYGAWGAGKSHALGTLRSAPEDPAASPTLLSEAVSSIFCLLERGEGGGSGGGVSISCVEVVGGDEYHDLLAGCAPGPIKQMMQRQEKERQRQQQQATKGRRLGAGGAPNGPLMIRCSSISASASSRRDSSLVGSRAALFDRNASMARSSAYDWGAPPHRALSIKRGPGVGGEVASSTRASKTLQMPALTSREAFSVPEALAIIGAALSQRCTVSTPSRTCCHLGHVAVRLTWTPQQQPPTPGAAVTPHRVSTSSSLGPQQAPLRLSRSRSQLSVCGSSVSSSVPVSTNGGGGGGGGASRTSCTLTLLDCCSGMSALYLPTERAATSARRGLLSLGMALSHAHHGEQAMALREAQLTRCLVGSASQILLIACLGGSLDTPIPASGVASVAGAPPSPSAVVTVADDATILLVKKLLGGGRWKMVRGVPAQQQQQQQQPPAAVATATVLDLELEQPQQQPRQQRQQQLEQERVVQSAGTSVRTLAVPVAPLVSAPPHQQENRKEGGEEGGQEGRQQHVAQQGQPAEQQQQLEQDGGQCKPAMLALLASHLRHSEPQQPPQRQQPQQMQAAEHAQQQQQHASVGSSFKSVLSFWACRSATATSSTSSSTSSLPPPGPLVLPPRLLADGQTAGPAAGPAPPAQARLTVRLPTPTLPLVPSTPSPSSANANLLSSPTDSAGSQRPSGAGLRPRWLPASRIPKPQSPVSPEPAPYATSVASPTLCTPDPQPPALAPSTISTPQPTSPPRLPSSGTAAASASAHSTPADGLSTPPRGPRAPATCSPSPMRRGGKSVITSASGKSATSTSGALPPLPRTLAATLLTRNATHSGAPLPSVQSAALQQHRQGSGHAAEEFGAPQRSLSALSGCVLPSGRRQRLLEDQYKSLLSDFQRFSASPRRRSISPAHAAAAAGIAAKASVGLPVAPPALPAADAAPVPKPDSDDEDLFALHLPSAVLLEQVASLPALGAQPPSASAHSAAAAAARISLSAPRRPPVPPRSAQSASSLPAFLSPAPAASVTPSAAAGTGPPVAGRSWGKPFGGVSRIPSFSASPTPSPPLPLHRPVLSPIKPTDGSLLNQVATKQQHLGSGPGLARKGSEGARLLPPPIVRAPISREHSGRWAQQGVKGTGSPQRGVSAAVGRASLSSGSRLPAASAATLTASRRSAAAIRAPPHQPALSAVRLRQQQAMQAHLSRRPPPGSGAGASRGGARAASTAAANRMLRQPSGSASIASSCSELLGASLLVDKGADLGVGSLSLASLPAESRLLPLPLHQRPLAGPPPSAARAGPAAAAPRKMSFADWERQSALATDPVGGEEASPVPAAALSCSPTEDVSSSRGGLAAIGSAATSRPVPSALDPPLLPSACSPVITTAMRSKLSMFANELDEDANVNLDRSSELEALR